MLILDNLFRRLHDANDTLTLTPYRPDPYSPTVAIARTHLLPRFGFPRDVGVIWGGTDDQIEDYVLGVFIGSAVILGVMTVCLLIMACLKCAGFDRVGFLCGHFEYEVDDEDDDEKENDEEDEEEENIIDKDGSSTGIDIDNDVGTTDNGNVSTGITAVKTIGSGEYMKRSARVSIAANKADVDSDSDVGDAASPLNDVSKSNDGTEDSKENTNSDALHPPRTIGLGEYKNLTDHVSIAVDKAVGDNGIPEARSPLYDAPRCDNGMGSGVDAFISNTKKALHPKHVKRFRLKVVRIGLDGKVIELRPKPVPEILYFKVKAVRFAFIVAGIGAIISAGLFYGLGVKKFQQSLVDTRTGIIRFNLLALQAINVTDELLDAVQKVENRLTITDAAIKVIVTRCDLQSFANATNFIKEYEAAKDQFISMSDAIKHLLNGFSDDMWNVIDATTKLYNQLDVLNIAFAFMVLIMCIMIVLILVMIIGVGFAVYDVENCLTCFMRRFLLLPMFVLQVFLATIFSAICFIGALSGSDFCIKPDQNAISILTRVAAGADESLSPLFTMMLFYLSGCQVINDAKVVIAVRDSVSGADAVLKVAHDMAEIFNSITPQEMLKYCNVEQTYIDHFYDFGTSLHEITHQLHASLYATLDIISCGSVHPVYSDLVHSAACHGLVGGIDAIFGTMLGIAVLSMLMVALRAALYPIQQSNSLVAAAEDEVLPEMSESSKIESACSIRAEDTDQEQQMPQLTDAAEDRVLPENLESSEIESACSIVAEDNNREQQNPQLSIGHV